MYVFYTSDEYPQCIFFILLMSSHNVCFYGELRKKILDLSPNTPPLHQILLLKKSSEHQNSCMIAYIKDTDKKCPQ